jgi:nicotinamidase-related amidase
MDEDARVMQIIALKDQAPLILDPRTALLVIDMQRDFVHPGYGFAQVLEKLVPGVTEGYFSRVRSSVIPNVQRLLEAFRDRGLPVFFTGTGTQVSSGRDLCCWLQDFDTLGMALLGCTAIDQSFRNLHIQSVVVCGLTTDVCVSAAARGCADRGYSTLPQPATATAR